jgi:hypothetical protein
VKAVAKNLNGSFRAQYLLLLAIRNQFYGSLLKWFLPVLLSLTDIPYLLFLFGIVYLFMELSPS